jgi:hypothetical protein
MSQTFLADFDLGEKVIIDGDKEIVATVAEICFGKGIEYKISWWFNGELKEHWVCERRLTKANG